MNIEKESSRLEVASGHNAYVRAVGALFAPGSRIPATTRHPVKSTSLPGWKADDLSLLISEGRRQADRQAADFERTISRSQILLTTAIALIAVVASFQSQVNRAESDPAAILWWLGLAAMVWGALGSAALICVPAEFESMDTAVMSEYEPPIEARVAFDYADMLRTGAETVATRLHLFHIAVAWIVVGASCELFAWILVNF